VNYYGTIFSATLALHLISKFIFNLCVEVKMPLDKWSMIDLICSVFNIVCFNMIGKTSPETIIDRKQKESLDYYVIAVVIVSWLRFFGYFLVVRSVSKLISTLMRMISDAVSFILIVSSYLLLMSTVFTTLFQSSMPDDYPDISTSLRTLYDSMLGSYNYSDQENYMLSNSILTMIHVFLSNIFLLNFLVAILSTVYEVMMEHGEFSFKSNKYEFIEKYSIAMLDTNGYAELVIHPPPINIFTLFILPSILRKHWMKKAADCFSKFMFWLENALYLMVFMSYETMLFPVIYFKVALTIVFLSSWVRLIPMLLFWLLIGPLVLVF
jgi:Polycystin cation channel